MRNAHRNSVVAVAVLMGLLSSGVSPGQSTQPAARPGVAATKAVAVKLTVAIIDSNASAPGSPEVGKQICDALVATLTGEAGFTLVDRSSMAHLLQEHGLNLAGVVDTDKAIKIGKLVGANVLVTVNAFTLDKQLYLIAKIIGTETSLVDGVIVKGAADADTGSLVAQLSEKLSKRIREAGPKLVAGAGDEEDPMPALKAQLAKLKLPRVAVGIPEQHLPAARPAARLDPAVETEIKMMLTECGFTVIDGDERDRNRAGVEVTIGGEAFSEFAARIGNLVSCSARVELKVTNRADGKLLLADRNTTRAADLSESLASKNALQKAGHAAGVRLLEYFAKNLPPAETPKP